MYFQRTVSRMHIIFQVVMFFLLMCMAGAEKCVPETNMLIGAYRRQCSDDGTWKPIQCWGSTGRCWCVDKNTGEKIRDVVIADDNCE